MVNLYRSDYHNGCLNSKSIVSIGPKRVIEIIYTGLILIILPGRLNLESGRNIKKIKPKGLWLPVYGRSSLKGASSCFMA